MAVAQIQGNHRDLLKSLGAWVSELVDDFPDYDEFDISEIVEERTGLRVSNEDSDAIRALYLRAKLQEYRSDDEAG